MAIPLTFAMTTAAGSPAQGTPSVALWYPGAAAWFAPNGALSFAGFGTWTIAANALDQPGQWPVLLYATASDAVPTANAYFPPGVGYEVGNTAYPFPVWLGTDVDEDVPAVGLSLAAQISLLGGTYGPAAGTIAEPGADGYGAGGYGAGLFGGHGAGFYVYWPTPTDVAAAGIVSLYVTATGATPATAEFVVSTGGGQPLTTPTISWGPLDPIDSATPLSSTQLDASAGVPGSFAYAPAAGVILPAGSYTLSALFTPTDTGTYSSAVATTDLVVTQASSPTPTPTPTPSPTGTRDRDILNAIRSALDATGAFDGVYLWGFATAAEQSAEATRAVSIIPADFGEDDRWDSVADGSVLEANRVKLEIMARDDDIQARDEAAGRLLNVCRDALNGRSLAGMTFPYLTRVRRGVWKEPVPPQRTIEAVLEYTYDVPSLGTYDTTP